MDKSERAKQFMPFAALKGYDEALRAKEKVVVSKKELSEDAWEELNCTIQSVEKGDVITVVYYSEEDGEYIQVTGVLARIDLEGRTLTVVNTDIPLDMIYKLQK